MSYVQLAMIAVLLLFGLAESARGKSQKTSCLSYGHSCWGAHGKRSEGLPHIIPREEEQAPVPLRIPVEDMRWVLSRLASGSSNDEDDLSYRMGDVAVDLPDIAVTSDEDPRDEAVVLLTPQNNGPKRNDLHLYKLMNRAARKAMK